ncbi:hypothetical protein FIBSPDRAFT_532390 [Athelia psychrophila]|uniref:Uncharacterized protein n=1 Tax=Athelia psychrophila TaxID=1759441 RepID=A0A166J942_9AGAM|nr:hypothetical protein FIBSPDRAFT_532390 [Fibularhizoctonia sp. CBS 109695]
MAVLDLAGAVTCRMSADTRDPGTAQRDQRVVRGGDEMALGADGGNRGPVIRVIHTSGGSRWTVCRK